MYYQEAPADVGRSAMIAVRDCMGAKPEERVLIVTDTVRKDIGIPLYQAALEIGCEAMLMEMRPRERSGEEPPRAISHAMMHADVVIAATRASLSHTEARKEACSHGARVASIPIQEEDREVVMRMFAGGGMTADYRRMERQIDRLYARLRHVREIRATTEIGTDIAFTFGDREWHRDTGIAHRPGEFTNLPGGEVFIAPYVSNGTVLIDGSFGDFGLVTYPMELTIRDGFCVGAEGEFAGDLERLFGLLGHNARNVAELGIGMNPKAKLCGILLEDEKVGNTIHIALGNNTSFGGSVSVQLHYDGIITNPRLLVDGEQLNLEEYL